MGTHEKRFQTLPKLIHFNRLFDKNGILQHSFHSQPDPGHGYSIDDNARALVVLSLLAKYSGAKKYETAIRTVIRFIEGQKSTNGSFKNYLYISDSGDFLSREEAGDGLGEVIWSCGYYHYLFPRGPHRNRVIQLTSGTLDGLKDQKSLRLMSYALGGLAYQLMADPKNKIFRKHAQLIADQLVVLFDKHSTAEWLWFEKWLSYGNAILPWSLLLAGDVFSRPAYLRIGLTSLDFLLSETTLGQIPVPVGQGRWYEHGGVRSVYDQQPIEAGYTVLACITACRVTGKKKYRAAARRWFEWFYGRNIENLSLIDESDGGCYDGLEPWKVNQNKGAESTLCYLLAHLLLYADEKKLRRW